MITLTSLASSSAGCCYRLSCRGNTSPLLLDAGLSFKKIQEGLGFGTSTLAGCLLTHAHGDHAKGVDGLLKNGVTVYATAGTMEELSEFARGHHRIREVRPYRPFNAGGWVVQAFDAVHDAGGAVGYLIGILGKRILFLTDSAYSKNRFKDLTHIFIECNHSNALLKKNSLSGELLGMQYDRITRNHMSLERLLDMLEKNDLSKVENITLLHLSRGNSDAEAFRQSVQRATGIPTSIADESGGIS